MQPATRALVTVLGLAACNGGTPGATDPTTATTGAGSSGSSGSTSDPPTTGPEPTSSAGSTTTTGTSTTDITAATTDITTTDITTTTTGDDTTGTTGTTGTTSDLPPIACNEPTDSDTAGDPNTWTRTVAGPMTYSDFERVVIDRNGAIVIAGEFSHPFDFGDGPMIPSGFDFDVGLARHSGAGDLLWSVHVAGADAACAEFDIAVDCAGEVVLACSYFGTITLGGQSLTGVDGTFMFGGEVYRTTDIALAKFTADGALLWARSFGDAAYQRAPAVATTPGGGIVIAGRVQGEFDLDGVMISGDDTDDALLAEFGPDGELVWHRSFAGPGHVSPRRVEVAADTGFITIQGVSVAVDFGGGTLPDDELDFLAQFDANGQHRWSRRAQPDTNPSRLASAADGAVVVTGVDFSTDVVDLFTTRYDASGTLEWTRTAGAEPGSEANGVAIASGPGGEIAVAGFFTGTINPAGGAMTSMTSELDEQDVDRDMVLIRYSAAGDHLMSERRSGTGTEDPGGLAFGPDGELALIGNFGGTLDLGTGPKVAAGVRDLFLHRTAP